MRLAVKVRVDSVQEDLSSLCAMITAWISRKQKSTTTTPATRRVILAISVLCKLHGVGYRNENVSGLSMLEFDTSIVVFAGF